MKVLVIGNGGIGSNLCVPLLKMLVYHKNNGIIKSSIIIKIMDGDKVEPGNLIRQDFTSKDCADFKSDATAMYLGSLCKSMGVVVKIISLPFYLKKNNLTEIKERDIVLVGVDNYITRKIIEDRARKLKNILVVFGGNEYDDGDVNVLLKVNGKLKTPLLTKKHPEILKKDKFPDEMSCEEAAVSSPQLILTNMLVANTMLEAVNAFITKEITWHEKMFDLTTGNMRTIHL